MEQVFSSQRLKSHKLDPGRGALRKAFAFQGFPDGSDSKESVCNADSGFNPWVRKIP